MDAQIEALVSQGFSVIEAENFLVNTEIDLLNELREIRAKLMDNLKENKVKSDLFRPVLVFQILKINEAIENLEEKSKGWIVKHEPQEGLSDLSKNAIKKIRKSSNSMDRDTFESSIVEILNVYLEWLKGEINDLDIRCEKIQVVDSNGLFNNSLFKERASLRGEFLKYKREYDGISADIDAGKLEGFKLD